MLGEIHPFLIEKHKQMRLAKGFRVAVNREVAALSVLFNRMIDWGRFEGWIQRAGSSGSMNR